jgi:general stress protein 26
MRPGNQKGYCKGHHQLGGGGGTPPADWAGVADKLQDGSRPAPDAHNARTTWLSTVNEDGRPHVTAVGALWLDGSFWFQTGSGTRKGRNVARDPRCSIAVSIRDADVVVEGEAARETDPATLARLAEAWANQGGPPKWMRAGRVSPPLSTRRRRGHHRGTCIASSHTLRSWRWERSRAG